MKSISKDTWQLLLAFIEQMKNDLSNYDPTGTVAFSLSLTVIKS
jgi:hypothetical protein